MNMENKKRLGLALCGSYCTYEKLFQAAARLAEQYELVPIMSENAAETDTRFGTAAEHIKRLMLLSGKKVVTTIAEAEPLGPSAPMDALLIAPCTGNTLAKLSLGITDTAVTMAAKAHLRNGRPIVLAVSTNDALAGAAENIGKLLVRKHFYFVPFRQDDWKNKPTSMVADFSLIPQTLESALQGQQIQPILLPGKP